MAVVAHGVSPLLGTKERLSSLLPSIVYTERTKGSPFPTNQFSRRFLFPQQTLTFSLGLGQRGGPIPSPFPSCTRMNMLGQSDPKFSYLGRYS